MITALNTLIERLFVNSDKKLLATKTDLLFFHLRGVLLGDVGIACLLTWVLWDAVEHSRLLIWLGVIMGLSLTRFVISQIIAKEPTQPEEASWKMSFHLFFVLASGITWGVGGLLFMAPDNPGYLAFLLLVLAGMSAGCLASYATFPPLYFAFSVPTIAPIAAYLIVTNNNVVPVAGYFMSAFLAINLFYCFNLGRAIERSLSLQFENVDLMERLKEQKDIAESSNIAKSKFLAAASHDLRQPIHALGLFISALENHTKDDKSVTLVERIKQSVEAMSSLFHSLLNISKLDAGIVEVDLSHFQIRDVLQKIVAEYESSATEKGLVFVCQSEQHVVYSDPVLTERILRNLISNAIRYTHKGQITLSTLEKEGEVIVEVMDTGIGIPADQREHVFSEYHQLNNPERDREKGLGLGLAIVKRSADLLDLSVELDSIEGRGSSFRISLPKGDIGLIKQVQRVQTPWDLTGIHVVVIDDEADILRGMEEILNDWGCNTILAQSSQEAIDQLKTTDIVPDLILSDYRLREHQTGADAIAQIYQCCNKEIPAILITGDTSADRLSEANASGYRLLHKPISPSQLRTSIYQEVSAD